MKIQPHHLDLTETSDVIFTTFEVRTQIQIEMIRDHAWLNAISIEEACHSWVHNGWAVLFAEHYFLS